VTALAAILVVAMGIGSVLTWSITRRVSSTPANLPIETVAPAKDMPAAEELVAASLPALRAKTVKAVSEAEPAAIPEPPAKQQVLLYVQNGPQKGPPVTVEWHDPANGSWVSVSGEHHVEEGVHEFRFSRPDFEPVLRSVDAQPRAGGTPVRIPPIGDWQPKPALAKLLRVEGAWAANDNKALLAEFRKDAKPVFEWPGHERRFAELHHRWVDVRRAQRRNPPVHRAAKAAQHKDTRLTASFEKPAPSAPPVVVAYRPAGTRAWKPLRNAVTVPPGTYDIRFLRPDYRTIPQQIKVEPGRAEFVIPGPHLAEWRPGQPLQELVELERALADGRMDVLTERLAQPRPGTFKFGPHAERLAHVREEWYQRLMDE
jgi:hypothetical protein